MVSYHSAKFDIRRHFGSGDIFFLVTKRRFQLLLVQPVNIIYP